MDDGFQDLIRPLFAFFADQIRRRQVPQVDRWDVAKPREQLVGRHLFLRHRGTVTALTLSQFAALYSMYSMRVRIILRKRSPQLPDVVRRRPAVRHLRHEARELQEL